MTNESGHRPLVVVGVDGSAESVTALRWAARYAAASGASVRVVLAWHRPPGAGVAPADASGPASAQARRRIESDLARAVAEVYPDPAAAGVETAICDGHPAQVLIDESKNADLLVVGHRGQGAFTGMTLGSVSIHCVGHASCSVAVIRG